MIIIIVAQNIQPITNLVFYISESSFIFSAFISLIDPADISWSLIECIRLANFRSPELPLKYFLSSASAQLDLKKVYCFGHQ